MRAERARELLYALHDAWNARDLERLISYYVDEMTHWSNVGGPDCGALSIIGKDAFRAYLEATSVMESISVPHNFRFAGGLGRASVEFYVRDSKTGHRHTGTYRQVVSYRDDKILRIETYHDAKALTAYCELISGK